MPKHRPKVEKRLGAISVGLVSIGLCSLLGGCGRANPCREAAEHVSECLPGSQLHLPTSCDSAEEAEALALLEMDCPMVLAMSSAGKAGFIQKAADTFKAVSSLYNQVKEIWSKKPQDPANPQPAAPPADPHASEEDCRQALRVIMDPFVVGTLGDLYLKAPLTIHLQVEKNGQPASEAVTVNVEKTYVPLDGLPDQSYEKLAHYNNILNAPFAAGPYTTEANGQRLIEGAPLGWYTFQVYAGGTLGPMVGRCVFPDESQGESARAHRLEVPYPG